MHPERRTFVRGLAGSLIAASLPVRGQPSPLPAIGFLRSTPAAPFANLVKAFRDGLDDTGFIEGRNVTIEYRWADNVRERLPALAAELVQRNVDVIVGNSLAAEAAKDATATIPIVFVTADDPMTRGLVRSLSRPDANVTGITFFGAQLGAKRLEFVRELVPKATAIAFLMDSSWPGAKVELLDIQAAARTVGLQIRVLQATQEKEFESAFAAMARGGAGAVIVGGSPVFTSLRRPLISQAARHRMPAIYDQRDSVVDGGLMSYAASFSGAYRNAGVYAGRILKGAKPSELPVLQPTTFELAVNTGTARTLGIAIPQAVLLRANDIIQ
jgi:putative tryptophan/tyrosine transport system substrate-binding protein